MATSKSLFSVLISTAIFMLGFDVYKMLVVEMGSSFCSL